MTSYTEEEAKSKWCPFARSWDTIVSEQDSVARPVTINRYSWGLPDGTKCLGSGCMAWSREFRTLYRLGDSGSVEHEDTGKGYCGLVVRGDRA